MKRTRTPWLHQISYRDRCRYLPSSAAIIMMKASTTLASKQVRNLHVLMEQNMVFSTSL